MKDEIKCKIQNLTLTATEKVIANHMLDNLDIVGLQPSTFLASTLGISDAAVVRFVKKLGFSGYLEFRKKMTEDLIANKLQQSEIMSLPSHKYAHNKEKISEDYLMQQVENSSLENIQKTFASLDTKLIEQIADIIFSSRNKYIAAFRGTACCAHYLASKLSLFSYNVMPIIHADSSAVEHLMGITDQDCIVVFTFPKYSSINYTIMEMAMEHHTKTILITDKLTCPLAKKADIVLTASIDTSILFNSYIAPMALADTILLAVVRKGNDIEKRMRSLEDKLHPLGLY